MYTPSHRKAGKEISVPIGIRAGARTLLMLWYFIFFFLSGFCGILYELVWMRLSMAQFGVTTALISIVLSVFMAGLGAGAWAAGTLMRRRGRPT